eukprot:3064134-Amphidinium_carterae.1
MWSCHMMPGCARILRNLDQLGHTDQTAPAKSHDVISLATNDSDDEDDDNNDHGSVMIKMTTIMNST